ncbi:hypothetical protein WJX79_000970 [Trebouxia sp. C0005]
MSEADEQYVRTIDGGDIPSEQAHRLCKKIFYAGFAGLPWLWFVNVWLFWPDLRHGHDLTVQKYARWSATGFGVIAVLLLAWIAVFSIGQGKLVGSSFFDEWNLANIDPGNLQA